MKKTDRIMVFLFGICALLMLKYNEVKEISITNYSPRTFSIYMYIILPAFIFSISYIMGIILRTNVMIKMADQRREKISAILGIVTVVLFLLGGIGVVSCYVPLFSESVRFNFLDILSIICTKHLYLYGVVGFVLAIASL